MIFDIANSYSILHMIYILINQKMMHIMVMNIDKLKIMNIILLLHVQTKKKTQI